MFAEHCKGPSHRVEISGWDEKEDFFVESAEMECQEAQAMHVSIHRPVREGALVFVRLLEQFDAPTAMPVAFRAGSVEKAMSKGHFDIALVKMRPTRRNCPRVS